MRYFVRLAALVGCIVAGLLVGPALAERKVALVIGNVSYGHHPKLPNVPNDAAAMAALLKAAKFDAVQVKENLGVAELRKALREFSALSTGADMAVVYFAGHGIEVNRTNYLIPVDARLAADIDVEDETVSLDRVLQLMEPAKRLRLVILDACRENPFAGSIKRTVATRTIGRGLGRIEPATSNTLIAFATKANAVAEDGKSANSPFTAALLKHLATPGLDVILALRRVRDEVLASTGNKQEPYFAGSLGGDNVSLAAPIAATETKVVPTLSQGQLSEVERTWAAVKDTTSIPALEAFRQQYGKENPVYDRLAEGRIEELKKLAMVAPPQVKPEAPKVAAPPAPIAFPPKRTDAPLTPAEERSLKPKDGFKECQSCPEMVVLPGGEFTMGGKWKTQSPQHTVTIQRPLAVGKFEVTFAEWGACVVAGGCASNPNPSDQGWGKGRRPVINVSWNDAKEYVAWLSRKTGKAYRLLSEAEWEYAARAGSTTFYAFGNVLSASQAQFKSSQTVEVGSFPANGFGLHDMHGNVREWVEDSWHPNYEGAPVDGSVWRGGALRVQRGGHWHTLSSIPLESRFRPGGIEPSDRSDKAGFRVARTL
jgi:formylglycine-generating enzyme required for sulfatase activity